MRIVDFHNHYYPPVYVEALKSSASAVLVTYDKDGNPCVHYPGNYNILVPGHHEVNGNPAAVRLALDFAGPDRILAGSGYPHQIGSIPLMIEPIRGLDVGEDVKRRIVGANAAALLGLAS